MYCVYTVYPKKYAQGFCYAVLCCGYIFTDFLISIRLTSLALWQSNDCPSASKATLMNMDKYFMWIHYERLHNHNKAKHNKTVCICRGIYCTYDKYNTLQPAFFMLKSRWQYILRTLHRVDICRDSSRSVALCRASDFDKCFLAMPIKQHWKILNNWAPSQYKDRLISVWRFLC